MISNGDSARILVCLENRAFRGASRYGAPPI